LNCFIQRTLAYLHLIYPQYVSIGELRRCSYVAFIYRIQSFPERQDSETTEDVTFHFNIRNNSPDISLSSPNPPYGSPCNLYGTCIFRQEYDSTTKRRFNQKSLVAISNHEFPAFFAKLLNILTENGVINDPLKLQVACSEISSWNPPAIGHQDLHFLGYLLALEM
jgi:hypothetical protein